MLDNAQQTRTRLPPAVYDLAVRLGVNPDENRPIVKLTQTGRMKRNLDTESWMAFTAKQTLSSIECAFDWRAQFGPLGMISVRDALKDGEASLDVTALGFIPIARAEHSAALVRGELMRYLAKLGANVNIPTDDGANAMIVGAGLGTRSPGEDAGTESEVVEALQAAVDCAA